MDRVRLTNEDVGGLCQSLAYFLHAGIGSGDAFVLLVEDEADKRLSGLLLDMARRADMGMSLAENVREAACFPDYMCALLEVGEHVGKLEESLEALARFYEGRARLERRIRAALRYPCVLLLTLLAVTVVLLVWVLPVFNDVYIQLGSRLTGFAGGLLMLGDALRRALPVLCVLLCAVILAVILLVRSEKAGRKLLDIWRARRGDRGVAGMICRARFAQAMSMALSSGLTAQEALELAAMLAQGSEEFQKRCASCREHVQEGASLAAALRESELMPGAQCRMLEAGMRSGEGETVMERIAAQLLEESEEALESRMGKIEPTMVVIMSALVGVILLSVMLPLVQVMAAIG